MVFFDYNGNGQRDEGESPIIGIKIKVQSRGTQNARERFECEITTGTDGRYRLEGIMPGSYMIHISSIGDQDFGYILPSPREAIPIARGLQCDIKGDTRADIPLAVGSHVLPFPLGVNYEIGTWYDRDPRTGQVANWMGETGPATSAPHTSVLYSFDLRVEDGHYAVDYVFHEETPIVASDAGVVIRIERDIRQPDPSDHIVQIKTITGLILDIGHVRPIDGLHIGQKVSRGELIGYAASYVYPPPFTEDYQHAFLIHIGFVPPGCTEYGPCLLDPYPDLWTTRDFDKARVMLDQQ